MKKAIVLFISALFAAYITAQGKMTADPEKTTLTWLGERPLMQETGTINLKDGWLIWGENRVQSGEFTIDMTTIKDAKGNARLEGHLKSDDFFNVEKFPVSKLVITGSDVFSKGLGVVRGSLTIRDITLPIEFKASTQKKDEGTWFYANIIVDRSKYNVRYGSGTFFENLGDRIIHDEFKLKVNLLVK